MRQMALWVEFDFYPFFAGQLFVADFKSGTVAEYRKKK